MSKVRRGLALAVALLCAASLQAVPAFAGTASPGDTVIDAFTAGTGSWSACGNDTFAYYQDASIIGGARELTMRDGGSCHFGPFPARMSVDATQGTASWFGNNVYAPEQHFSYGTEIGTIDHPWSVDPNKSKAVPLHLSLSLSDQIVVQVVQVNNPFFYVRLRDANGQTYQAVTNLTVGTNLIPLSAFTGLGAAAAAHIDGISFNGSNRGNPDVVSLFAIRGGNTAPSVSVTGVSDGASYEMGAVPAAGCDATDAEDGPSSPTPTLSAITGPLAAHGAGSQTVTCTVTDAGGLSATATATYAIVDTTAPTLAGAPTTSPNGAGWYNSPVTIHWTASDAGTGVDPSTMPGDVALSSDGVGQTAAASVADYAGNTTSATSAPAVNIDQTAPVVTYTGSTSYTVDQTVAITCVASDALSGVASTTCTNVTGAAAGFGATNSASASAVDVAGNTGTGSVAFTVSVDYDSLCRLAAQYSNGALGNSLCAKLQAAKASAGRGQLTAKNNQLDAFRKEVQAQSGKALTTSQASTLLTWVALL